MKNVFDYCYYFCYQMSVKSRKFDPKSNAVYALLIVIMLMELLLLILITRLTRMFLQLPRANNLTVNILIAVGGNGLLWYWMGKYFKRNHRQIVKNRFQPTRTSDTIDSLIYLGVVITIFFLMGVISFCFTNGAS